MLPLHELRRPIADIHAYRVHLAAVQGNILRGHGRDVAHHVLLRFHPDVPPGTLRERLGDLADSVTTAWDNLHLRRPGEISVSVGISAAGYQALGYPPRPELLIPIPTDRLSLDSSDWEPAWRSPSAIVINAGDAEIDVGEASGAIWSLFQDVAEVFIEPAHVLRDPAINHPMEHFGFADGLSQPIFFQEDLPPAASIHWSVRADAGPYLVLTPDPYSPDSEFDAGSCLAVLKIEQDVRAFRTALARRTGESGIDEDLAAARIIGRYSDGTPLAQTRQDPNAFDFRSDPLGAVCPRSAHIRKVNPRGETFDIEAERASRIHRTGMPYGDYIPRDTPLDQIPAGGRGLLFQCCQRRFNTQFEKIFRDWANDPRFPRPGAGRDALLNGVTGNCLADFVRIRGGEYFFLPSIRFLHGLSAQR